MPLAQSKINEKATIAIRQANDADLEAMCELSDQINAIHHAAAPAVFVARTNRELYRLFWQSMFLGVNSNVLLACDQDENGQVVGFITMSWQENSTIPFISKRRICRVGTIVVDNSQQNKGIGKMLMDAAMAWGREQGAVEIRLEVFDFNHGAMAFYQAQGYQIQSHIMCKTLD